MWGVRWPEEMEKTKMYEEEEEEEKKTRIQTKI